jgi:origin recognition complex subunit 5
MSSETLSTLLSATVPLPFIYLHHPHHPPASLVLNLPPHARLARIDAIEHHSPRLLYSGILNALGGNADSNGSWDGFVRSLRSVATRDVKGKGKGKGKANGNGNLIGKGSEVTEDTAVVILITKAERLRTVLGSGWTVITRLAELVRSGSSHHISIQLKCSGWPTSDFSARLEYSLGRCPTAPSRCCRANTRISSTAHSGR